MSEVDWNSVVAALSAVCAVIAAAVSLAVWRRARSSDSRIADGDRSVREHADRSLHQLREQLDQVSESQDEIRGAVARIEAHQESEEKHVLRPRDLGAIHEKVNRVAEEQAATRAQVHSETRMLSEQLRVLQNLVQQLLTSTHRSHNG